MSDVYEDEPPPEESATPVKKGVGIVSRLLLGQVTLPTWAFFLLAVVIGIPDWNSRYQFWLQAAKSSGGVFGAVATVLLLPYASLILAALGFLSLLLFEVRDRKLSTSRPSVAFAWASLVVCVAAIGSTAVYGYVELYLKREIAAGVAGLPREVPNLADPNRPQKPLVTASRVLLPDQQRILLEVLPNLREMFPSGISLMYDPQDLEVYNVMASYQKVLARSGIKTGIQYRQPNGPDDTGIRILVADIAHITEPAQALKRDLELADVRATFEQISTNPTKQENVPLGLYFAPAPLL